MTDLRSRAKRAGEQFAASSPRDRLRLFAALVLAASLAAAVLGALFAKPEPFRPPPPAVQTPAPDASPTSQDQAAPPLIYEEHHVFALPRTQKAEPAPPPALARTGAKLALVIDDLGENAAFAKRLLDLGLPLTLAVLPHLSDSRETARLAVALGAETIMHQPMEPRRRFAFKAGSGALTLAMDREAIRETLDANLATLPQASGVNNHMGSRFTENTPAMTAVLARLKERGLYFLDSQTTTSSAVPEAARKTSAPTLTRDVFLDNMRTTTAITSQLRRAENIALTRGQAIAIGHPYPETLLALSIWAAKRDKRVELVRLSQLIAK